MDIKEHIIAAKRSKITENDIKKKSLEELIRGYQAEIEYLVRNNIQLEKEIEEETAKSEPIGKPTIQYRDGWFELSPRLIAKANSWICMHEQEHHPEHFYSYADNTPVFKIGPSNYPHYETSISPTEVGDLASIVCVTCKRRVLADKTYSYYPTDEERNQYHCYLGEV